MDRFFNMDNGFWHAMNVISDFVILNLLVLLFALPELVVIYFARYLADYPIVLFILMFVAFLPIGPAVTAMYYVELKMVRKREGYLVRGFFHSFKENFVQASALMAVFTVFLIIGAMDIYMIMTVGTSSTPTALQVIIWAALLVILMIFVWVFPLQSHFANPVSATLKNALLMAVGNLPRTLGMMGCLALPVLALVFGQLKYTLLIFFLCGVSVPGILSCYLFSPAFKKIEPPEETDDSDPDAIPEELLKDRDNDGKNE